LRKIRAVRSVEQITRAMKTVASIRLRRAEQRLARARPYRTELVRLASQVAAVTQEHPFLQPRPVGSTLAVVVTSDRGLCGGYNLGAMRQAVALGAPEAVGVAAVGRKGRAQMARRGYVIVDEVVPLGGEPDARAIWELGGRIGARYLAGEVDRVVVVYSRFLGGASYRVQADTVVPLVGQAEEAGEMIFEPEPPELLAGLMDRYLRAVLLGAVLESSASEHAARVAAMAAATDNAEEMVRDLTMDYNKARQAGITKELSEIVGTAEATA
jgi:F-type H+-transporting ATPase subunit gamma